MHSLVKENFISEFLTQFFFNLNREKVTYCILRNYDELPKRVGNDIDIWVKDGEQKKFQKTLFTTAKKNGWDIIRYSPRLSYKGEGDYFLAKADQKLTIIHLDCWTFLYWRGMTYVDENIFHKNLIFHEKGFYVPLPGIEGSINLLKNLIYHKKVQDKYKKQIIVDSKRDTKTFTKAIIKPFGRKSANFIVNAAKEGKWDELERMTNTLRRTLFVRGLSYKPVLQLKHLFVYLYGQVKKFLAPRCGLFIVLIGPDGSGKTTTAKAVLESEIKRLFQRKMYFHGHFSFLPELKKIVAVLKMDKNNAASLSSTQNPDTSSEPFGLLRSTLYPLYYGLDYFLGHVLIWKERARGGVVVFDRYFYDYFIQKQFAKCPRWLLNLISKIIPQPDILIYLKNNPEIIYTRKPELPIEEINRQSKICVDITRRFKSSFVIDTSVAPNEVVKKIQRIIIHKVKENQQIKS